MTQHDPFDSAREGFVKMDDLKGRLILVSPTGIGTRDSTLPGSQGKVYEFVESTTVVLDGGPDEMVTEVPMVLDGFQFSGQAITGQLKPKVARRGMVLGRLGQKPSQTKGFGPAWVLQEPTEDDKVLARRYLAEHPPEDPFV
jgi:hypothetical protein